MEALILCGGLGTRLKTVLPDHQKTVAPIGGRSFLEILLDHLRARGFRRFVLCAGYHADQVEKAAGADCVLSSEPEPLGTAGAIKYAESLIQSERFWVFNGDSFCDFDYAAMAPPDLVTMALVPASPDSDGGFVRLGANDRVEGFREKSYVASHSYINAGVYLCAREFFEVIPAGKKLSLELDVFPRISSRIIGYPVDAKLYDIGTPERLEVFRRVSSYKD